MKKGLMYVLTVWCALGIFTACSDDDDNSGKGGWEGISKTYEGAQFLNLKLGETTLALDNKSVVLHATSADQVSVTLNNIIPEDAALQVDAVLKEADGVYTLSGEHTITFSGGNSTGKCVVSIQGTVEKGILSLIVNRKVTSEATGIWNLQMTTRADGTKAAGVYTHIVTGNAQIDALLAGMAAPIVGQLIAQKVESVTAVLGENGLFSASWKPVGATEEVNIGEYTNALSIQYCVIDGKLMIAVDKAYISLLSILSGKLAEYDLSLEDIIALMVDLGGYYAIPIEIKTEGNNATFYLTKSTIVPVVKLAAPIITPLLPKEYQQYVPTILQLLPGMQTLDFGLVFTKNK